MFQFTSTVKDRYQINSWVN